MRCPNGILSVRPAPTTGGEKIFRYSLVTWRIRHKTARFADFIVDLYPFANNLKLPLIDILATWHLSRFFFAYFRSYTILDAAIQIFTSGYCDAREASHLAFDLAT